ncbi:hypothetical protein MRB53_042366 [Persea americana]|nr:hypothetical protein MRB53_042366 [Persea americana]
MEEQERNVLIKTLSSYSLYRPSLHSANQLRRTDYISLTADHKNLLPGYLQKLEQVDGAIARNAELVEDMLQTGSMAMLEEPWTDTLRRAPDQGGAIWKRYAQPYAKSSVIGAMKVVQNGKQCILSS